MKAQLIRKKYSNPQMVTPVNGRGILKGNITNKVESNPTPVLYLPTTGSPLIKIK